MVMIVYCDIVSVEKQLFFGLVELVVVVGVEGDLGVMFGYVFLFIWFKFGLVCVKKQNGDEEVFYVFGGFLEVQLKLVIVLVDIVECVQDMDGVQVEEVKQCVKEVLEGKNVDMDYLCVVIILVEVFVCLCIIE